MTFYKDKKVLVTGGTGLIGIPLVEMLIKEGSDVTVVSLDDASRIPAGAKFKQADLRYFEECLRVCEDKQIVFHLAGVKGSPAMTAQRPASFFVPTVMFNVNMMEAARRLGVERYLFTSSIGVYAPAQVFYEDTVWETFPSSNDRFAGWAKRIGELQAEAYKIEYDWKRISIVRPANVYGPYDNFDANNAMVIPSLIRRALEGENPLNVWGDGSQVRDFIHARDVAHGMMLMVEKGVTEPINLGSGEGITIKRIVEIIMRNLSSPPAVVWDTSKPAGDAKRIMDTSRAKTYGFIPQISIEDGIKETINWYINNRSVINKRYNAFTDPSMACER